ncbi:MAG TPA: hypothetical protein VGE43_19560 [Acidimicrobiales bacterium]
MSDFIVCRTEPCPKREKFPLAPFEFFCTAAGRCDGCMGGDLRAVLGEAIPVERPVGGTGVYAKSETWVEVEP